MRVIANIFSTFEEREVIKVKNYKHVKKIEVIDTKSFDRYKKMPMLHIARKAMFIFLFSPIFLVLKISFNLMQIGVDCTAYAWSYWDMAKALARLDFVKIFELSGTSRIDFFKHIAQDIIYIVRAPFFAVAMQFAAIIAIVSPNRARKAIAKIERRWNYSMDLSYDYTRSQDFKRKPLLKALFETLINRNESVVCYLAPCFQYGSLNDKHIIFPLGQDIKR